MRVVVVKVIGTSPFSPPSSSEVQAPNSNTTARIVILAFTFITDRFILPRGKYTKKRVNIKTLKKVN